jgi:SAM-dependent methyltransferase
VRLNDPAVVRAEYATEAGLEARRALYVDRVPPDASEEAFRAIAELSPRTVLEVGSGPGELSERIAGALGASVVAVDISERMVELARDRGVDARRGDVQMLPFSDRTFDCVLAAWMLYHVPDVGRGLAEIARVLRPSGHLVAVTTSEEHLAEARATAGVDMRGRSPFSRENGEAQLLRYFSHVERRDIDGPVIFSSHVEVRKYIASMVTMRDHADRVPEFNGPLRATRRVSIFIAER